MPVPPTGLVTSRGGRVVVRPPEVSDKANAELQAIEAAWCWHLRLQGWTLRMIAAATSNPPADALTDEDKAAGLVPGLGWAMSHKTVSERLEMARTKVMAPGVEAFRELQQERYDALLRAYLPGVESRDPAMMAGYRQTLGDLNTLMGANAPVRVQMEAPPVIDDPEVNGVLSRIRSRQVEGKGKVIEHD